MINDPSTDIFHILKSTKDCLIFKNNNQKFICKTFQIKNKTTQSQSNNDRNDQRIKLTQCTNSAQLTLLNSSFNNKQINEKLKYLKTQSQLHHPNLIQFSLSPSSITKISQQTYIIQIIHEHYSKLLQECLFYKYKQIEYDDDQIINTFEPILDVIEYLIKFNFQVNQFSMKNIVITENNTVKYIDDFLLSNSIQLGLPQIKQKQNVYQQIANVLFSMIFPSLKNVKSWKNKLKIIKQKRSKQMYIFLSNMLNKGQVKCSEVKKIKKIKKQSKITKKQNLEDSINQCNFENKKNISETTNCNKHQGKQNKLQQTVG